MKNKQPTKTYIYKHVVICSFFSVMFFIVKSKKEASENRQEIVAPWPGFEPGSEPRQGSMLTTTPPGHTQKHIFVWSLKNFLYKSIKKQH